MENHLEFYKRWNRLAGPYFAWQARQFAPYIGSRIADVGCGLGNFAPFFRDRDVYLGLEPDRALADEFRRLHCGGCVGLAAHGDILSPDSVAELKAARIDTIICVNVLEHIGDDRQAMVNMAEGALDGGYICIIVPAHSFLYGSLDRLDGHFRRYSKKSLLSLVQRLPVTVRSCYYMNLPGAIGWFIKGKLIRETRQEDENYQAMNLILPVVSAVERVCKPPFGLSLVAVLQKTARP